MDKSKYPDEAAHDMDVLAAPKDLSHLFSRVTKLRKESAMKGFYRFQLIPGIENLAGGTSLSLSECLPH